MNIDDLFEELDHANPILRRTFVQRDVYKSQRDEARSERDEARRVARRLYKRLCDEHIAYISAKAVADYWGKKANELQRELDELRDAEAVLQRLDSITNPPDYG
jgi:hypothetical protein